MIYAIPVVGWLIGLAINMSMMVPFWYAWTVCGFGTYYFGEWIPYRFGVIPYWDCVGLSVCASILRLFSPFRNNTPLPEYNKK